MCCFPCYLWCNKPRRRPKEEDQIRVFDVDDRWITTSRRVDYRYFKRCLLVNTIFASIIIYQNWPKVNELLRHYEFFDMSDTIEKYTIAALYPLQTCRPPKTMDVDGDAYHYVLSQEELLRISARSENALPHETGVWQPMGFSVRLNCSPFPVLNWHDQFQCKRIFEEWMKIAENSNHKNVAKNRTLPQDMDAFLMNGTATLKFQFDDSQNSGNDIWTAQSIERYLNGPLNAIYELSTYGKFAGSINSAFRRYHDRIRNSRGLVIGSITPWIELLALRYGASSITTAEYRPIRMVDKRMHYIHPMEMAKNWENQSISYDFIASYSSIEHSGLGRYGDPLDSIGDLREMQKLHCLLRYDSLLFIGLPVGRDEVFFNARRVYGNVRMAMMFAGWRLQAVYYDDRPEPYDFSGQDFTENASGLNGDKQLLFVLKKN